MVNTNETTTVSPTAPLSAHFWLHPLVMPRAPPRRIGSSTKRYDNAASVTVTAHRNMNSHQPSACARCGFSQTKTGQ